MQISDLDKQIIQILEDKHGYTIDKDDPLLLTITAQTLVTEHLLDLHKKNMESQFEIFKNDLTDILKSTKIESAQTKQILSSYIRKMFLSFSDEIIAKISPEFLKAGQEYKKAQKWYKTTKFWALGSIIASAAIYFFVLSPFN